MLPDDAGTTVMPMQAMVGIAACFAISTKLSTLKKLSTVTLATTVSTAKMTKRTRLSHLAPSPSIS